MLRLDLLVTDANACSFSLSAGHLLCVMTEHALTDTYTILV